MYSKRPEIEKLANKLMLPFDIAIIIGEEPSVLVKEINDSSSDVSDSFYRGYLKRKVEIHNAIFPDEVVDIELMEFHVSWLKEFEEKLEIQLYE